MRRSGRPGAGSRSTRPTLRHRAVRTCPRCGSGARAGPSRTGGPPRGWTRARRPCGWRSWYGRRTLPPPRTAGAPSAPTAGRRSSAVATAMASGSGTARAASSNQRPNWSSGSAADDLLRQRLRAGAHRPDPTNAAHGRRSRSRFRRRRSRFARWPAPSTSWPSGRPLRGARRSPTSTTPGPPCRPGRPWPSRWSTSGPSRSWAATRRPRPPPNGWRRCAVPRRGCSVPARARWSSPDRTPSRGPRRSGGCALGGGVRRGQRLLVDRIAYDSHYLGLMQVCRLTGAAIEVVGSTPEGTLDLDALSAALERRRGRPRRPHPRRDPPRPGQPGRSGRGGVPVGPGSRSSSTPARASGSSRSTWAASGARSPPPPAASGCAVPEGPACCTSSRPSPSGSSPPGSAGARPCGSTPTTTGCATGPTGSSTSRCPSPLTWGSAGPSTTSWRSGIEAISARVGALAEGLRRQLSEVGGVTVHDGGDRRSGIVSFTVEGAEPRSVFADGLGPGDQRVGQRSPVGPARHVPAQPDRRGARLAALLQHRGRDRPAGRGGPLPTGLTPPVPARRWPPGPRSPGTRSTGPPPSRRGR